MRNLETRLDRLEANLGDSKDAEAELNRAVMLHLLAVPQDRRLLDEYSRKVAEPMMRITGTEAERFKAVLGTSADLKELANRVSEVWVRHRDAVQLERAE